MVCHQLNTPHKKKRHVKHNSTIQMILHSLLPWERIVRETNFYCAHDIEPMSRPYSKRSSTRLSTVNNRHSLFSIRCPFEALNQGLVVAEKDRLQCILLTSTVLNISGVCVEYSCSTTQRVQMKIPNCGIFAYAQTFHTLSSFPLLHHGLGTRLKTFLEEKISLAAFCQ